MTLLTICPHVSIVRGLAYRFGHFIRFSGTDAHTAIAVPHHYDGVKTETASALYHLGATVDRHHLVLKLRFYFVFQFKLLA